jgi:hypothetical protein
MSVTFVRYSPKTSAPALTAQLIECYRDVFADTPWHEWLKCSECGNHWGKKDAGLLATMGYRHCGKPLVDFWPRELVHSDILHEITPDSSCWLAIDQDKVVGFCWGYGVSLKHLESKLQLNIAGQSGYGDFSWPEVVAYQDEVGVLTTHRNLKLAKQMVALRHDDFLAQGLNVGVVRTRQYPEPSTTFLWYTKKLGYNVVARYPGADGRVILARQFEGLRQLLVT